jgi:DNA-directed RNA polymerase, mitochondrial
MELKYLNIEAQLGLERTMVQRGIERYEEALRKAEDAGRGAETPYAHGLLRDYLLPVIDGVRSLTGRTKGRPNRANVLLSDCEPEKAAFLAMQVLLNSFTFDAKLASTAVQIGRRIEDEIRFSRFEDMHRDYFRAVQRDFERNGTSSYRHKHRVLTHKANEFADEWVDWTPSERASVGMKLLDIVLTRTDLLEKRTTHDKGKTTVYLQPTAQAVARIKEHNEFAQFLFPDKMPCCVPPDEWTAIDQGGYYSPELRRATPMVKTSSKRHRRVVERADLSKVMQALNIVQAVPWQENADVLAVLQQAWANNLPIGIPHRDPLTVPPSPFEGRNKDTLTEEEQERLTDWKHEAAEIHAQERERLSKALLTTRIVRMAEDYSKHRRFWYVWYADFRGRLYAATSGFAPQGPDLAKGLLRFAEGKPLGDEGWYWLRVHGANRYGYDKVSHDARVAWVDSNRDRFLLAASDPLAHTDVWASADKPWQFLAFLFEYRDCIASEAQGRPVSTFVSHLSVGLDGTCNGLQNFSAVLRDAVGGKATNLVSADLPADIYSEVARVCTLRLHALVADPVDGPMARLWLDYCIKHGKGSIPRGMAKRPVMTLPYGAKQQSCTKYIFESILGTDREFFQGSFKAACWLTPHLWAAIGDVVVAARDAMGWLQRCSSVMTRDNEPLIWDAHDGFRVYQGTRAIDVVQIETQLGGRFRLNVGNFSDKLDGQKQRNAVAPNFVHSLDAAHLRETVRRAAAEGVTSLSVIHDDYGTHAADTGKLHRIIREAFVGLYSEHDPLDAFRVAHEREGRQLPPMPPRGALQIKDVLQSEYFFS